MKLKSYLLSALCFTGILLMGSCSKPEDGFASAETFIRFTLDGNEYYFDNINTSRITDKSQENGSARIYPEDTPITLFLPLDVTKGTHEVYVDGSASEYRVAFNTGLDDGSGDFAHGGRIIIFNVTEAYVEGTFIAHVTSSVSKESMTLSDGRFRAYLN